MPFLSLEYLEYLEEVTDRCGDRNYETCTMDPGDLADTLEQRAQRIREAIAVLESASDPL